MIIMSFIHERCDILRNDKILRFAEKRVVFVKFTPRGRVAEERRIISEIPAVFHANSAINFRFLRSRHILFHLIFLLFFSFLHPPVCAAVARREIHGMSLVVSQAFRFHFCTSYRYDQKIICIYIHITLTDVSLLSRYLNGYYETA